MQGTVFPKRKGHTEQNKKRNVRSEIVCIWFSKEEYLRCQLLRADAVFRPDIDVIYISGGNTFGTMKLIREAGFDKAIVDYVNKGAVYVGGSAGAHIATADISHIVKYDEDTCGLIDFSGLGLFDGILICHYDEDRKQHFEELKASGKYAVIALKDNESIIIKD